MGVKQAEPRDPEVVVEDVIGEDWKDQTNKVTTETSFGETRGDLRVYREDMTPQDYDAFPKVTITMGEDLDKFQYGIMRITTQNIVDGGTIREKSYLVQVDGVMSIIYSVYAKTLNDLRKATFRQKTIRIYGFFKMLAIKLKQKYGN